MVADEVNRPLAISHRLKKRKENEEIIKGDFLNPKGNK